MATTQKMDNNQKKGIALIILGIMSYFLLVSDFIILNVPYIIFELIWHLHLNLIISLVIIGFAVKTLISKKLEEVKFIKTENNSKNQINNNISETVKNINNVEATKIEINEDNNNLIINPSNILEAGKKLKTIVYCILIMIAITLYVLFIKKSSTMSAVSVYIYIGIVSLSCNAFILYKLFIVGDNLEKSVKKHTVRSLV